MPDLNLQMPSAPEGFCNYLNDADWVQTLLNLIAQGVAKFEGSGFTVILNQSTAPGPNDRDKLWRDPDTGLVYEWTGGAWVTPHPEAPSGKVRRMWVGTPTELLTYDGGAAGTVGANSGPMWEEDTDFAGRSPMGPGAIPTSNPAKTLAVVEAFGEGAHTQTEDELAAHTHDTNFKEREAEGNDNTGMMGFTGTDRTPVATTSTGLSEPFNVVHPVFGTYIIKRTARQNYVGA